MDDKEDLYTSLQKLIDAGSKIGMSEMFYSPVQKDCNDCDFRTVGHEDVKDKPLPSHVEGTIAEFWEHDYTGYAKFFTLACNNTHVFKEAADEIRTLQWQVKLAQSNFEHYFKKYLQSSGKTVGEAEEEWERERKR